MAEQLRLHDLAHDAVDDSKKQCGFRDHAPAGINCRGERERNGGGDKGPGVGTNRSTAPTMPQRIGLGTPIKLSPNPMMIPNDALIPVKAKKYRLSRCAASSRAFIGPVQIIRAVAERI